jgi:hypothetical protein
MDLLVLPELREHRAPLELLEPREAPVPWEFRALPEGRVSRELLERLDRQERMDRVELRVRKELKDHPEPPEAVVRTERVELLDLWEPQEALERLELTDKLVALYSKEAVPLHLKTCLATVRPTPGCTFVRTETCTPAMVQHGHLWMT